MNAPEPTAALARTEVPALRLHYLDGLRGWAALAVVIFHSTWELFKGYLPAVRTSAPGLINDGKLAVYVFFVLSGLVLAHPYLRTRRIETLQTTALRRYVRLTIPIAAASALALGLMWLGWMRNVEANRIVESQDWLGAFYLQAPTLVSWAKFAFYNVFFHYDLHTSYDIVLWTMPFELAGSFVVFGLLALAGASLRARLLWYAAAAVLAVREAPEMLSFICGIALAEIATSRRYLQAADARAGDVAGVALLALAFAGSVWLRDRYDPVLCAGLALLVVLGAMLSARLRALLETPLSQALGRISFPLYLVHTLVICSASSMLILKLADLGWSRAAVVGVVAPATIAASLAAAALFAPVERLAIAASRAFSSLVTGRRARPFASG